MNQAEKDNIIRLLNERGVRLPCSRCGGNNFSLLDGYFNSSINPQLDNNVILGGPSIPTVGIICNRCGFINYHAIGALGLINNNRTENLNETRNENQNETE